MRSLLILILLAAVFDRRQPLPPHIAAARAQLAKLTRGATTRAP